MSSCSILMAESRCFSQFSSSVMHFSQAIVFHFNQEQPRTSIHTCTHIHTYAHHVKHCDVVGHQPEMTHTLKTQQHNCYKTHTEGKRDKKGCAPVNQIQWGVTSVKRERAYNVVLFWCIKVVQSEGGEAKTNSLIRDHVQEDESVYPSPALFRKHTLL